MARKKGPVRVPQLVVVQERQVTGTPSHPHDDKPSNPVQVAAVSSKQTQLEDSPVITSISSSLSSNLGLAAEGKVTDGPDLTTQLSECPHCGARFIDMPVQDHREHVESCSAANDDGESVLSEISNGEPDLPIIPNGNGIQNGEESDDDLPLPYGKELISYPEIKPLSGLDGDNDSEQDDLQKFQLSAITDVTKFVDSLENMDEMDYRRLYTLLVNAQRALIAWQNEWMDLEIYTSNRQPFPPGTAEEFIIKHMEKNSKAREPVNPRLPKSFPTGGPEDDVRRAEVAAKYQDQLEAALYGYKWDHRAARRGDQQPLHQRIVESRPDGRDLRQRVPTQRATEGDLDTTPETDDDTGKRRGRGQRIRYDSAGVDDSGRGVRQRFPSSRVESISRDQTPVKTFASGKKIGRPRKNPIQIQQSQSKQSASRIKEYKADHFVSGSTYKNGYGGEDEEDQDVPRQTTEFDSRPTTSSSVDSSAVGPGQEKSSGKGKKRSNTSDFEDALPSNKRIKSNGANGHDQSIGKESMGAEPNSRSVKMRTIQKESWAKDDGTRKNNLSNSMQERWAQAKKEGRKTLGPSTAAIKKDQPIPATTTKAKKGPKVKGEGEPSAASLNMLNRWKKKREALAMGLTPPNIGRYAKAKSVTSTTPNATQTPEQSNAVERKSSAVVSAENSAQSFNATYGEEPASASGIQDPADIAPSKKRGGRPKKVPGSGTGSIQNGDSSEYDQATNLLAAGDQEVTHYGNDRDVESQNPSTGNRGGRRKRAEGIASSTEPSSQSQPSSGSAPVRTSGRIRKPSSRQASAAATSQSSTRPSSRAGNTVTPTPAPVQGLGIQTGFKLEQTHSFIVPKARRSGKDTGEVEHSASVESSQEPGKRKRVAEQVLETTEDADNLEFGDVDGEPASKRRRGGRPKKDIMTTSPGPEFETPGDRSLPRGKSGRFTQSSSSSSTSSGAIIVEDKALAPGGEGSSSKRRKGGQFPDMVEPFTASSDKGKGRTKIIFTKKPIKDEPAVIEQNGEALSELPINPEEARAAAARQAKSEKMSQIMKARWSRGDMTSVMEKKKANNRARKAAEEAATAGISPATAIAAPILLGPPPVSADGFIAPPPKIRKPTGAAAHKRNQKRLSEPSSLAISTSGNITSTTVTAPSRKPSEYEIFQDLMSPTTSGGTPGGRRAPRNAALKAQQSFSSLNDDDDDNDEDQEDETEEEEQLLAKQLQVDAITGAAPAPATGSPSMSEYDHFKALASPIPGVVLGKRKRKPVMNLAEAMRMERGDDDEFEEE